MRNDTTPLNELSVRKSNEMVSAKYKSTLLENQIMTIALTRIEESARDKNAPLTATLYPGELKRIIGDPTHIYRTLKSVSKTMVGHTMFLEDRQGNFHAYAIVTDAEYQDGVFRVKFNESLRDHILGLEKNYTTYELSVLTDFKSNSSFRLYELLKKEIYKSRKSVNNGRVDVEYRISELRFMIGLANSDDAGVKNAMGRMGENIDWDKLYSLLDKKDKKYEAWKDMRRYVIEPAQIELEEKSNVRFDFDTYRSGRKIDRIVFHVYPNVPKNPEIISRKQRIIEKQARQLEIPRDLPEYRSLYAEYTGHNGLTEEDINLLIERAEGCADNETTRSIVLTVKNAIELCDKQGSIQNYMGWIIRCIERGGYKTTETIYGSKERAEVVNTAEQDLKTKDLASVFWNRTKARNGQKFQEFTQMLADNGLTLELFEGACESDAECGERYVAWIKGELRSIL